MRRRPEEGARRIALGHLDEARVAAARLHDPDDAEALHDFRVAVRRLRSTARAYRLPLGGAIRKKHRRALEALQNATGGGRDAEVFLEWLDGEKGSLNAGQKVGASWLGTRLADRKAGAMANIRDEVADAFDALDKELRRRLATVEITIHLTGAVADGHAQTFGDLVATLIRDHAADLRDGVLRVADAEDVETAHETRILGKRFRYLLEPLADLDDAVPKMVKRCKKLQTVLGDLHDVHVFSRELGDAIGDAAAAQARRLHALTLESNGDPEVIRRATRKNERTGLLELTRRARAQADELFAAFRDGWIDGGADALAADADALANRLSGRGDLEIERKYLLTALPERAREAPSVTIAQGWLPGDRLRERIRRTEDADGGTRYARTIKLGEGLTRTELEEPTTREVFDALWPLTEGCRVEKRRYLVPADGDGDGALVFEVDEFLDRDLVLAEVELPSEDAEVTLPEWLLDVLDHEVTGDPTYVNLRLAR